MYLTWFGKNTTRTKYHSSFLSLQPFSEHLVSVPVLLPSPPLWVSQLPWQLLCMNPREKHSGAETPIVSRYSTLTVGPLAFAQMSQTASEQQQAQG